MDWDEAVPAFHVIKQCFFLLRGDFFGIGVECKGIKMCQRLCIERMVDIICKFQVDPTRPQRGKKLGVTFFGDMPRMGSGFVPQEQHIQPTAFTSDGHAAEPHDCERAQCNQAKRSGDGDSFHSLGNEMMAIANSISNYRFAHSSWKIAQPPTREIPPTGQIESTVYFSKSEQPRRTEVPAAWNLRLMLSVRSNQALRAWSHE